MPFKLRSQTNFVFDQIVNQADTDKTLIIKIGMGMRTYTYNHIFLSGPNMILICALEVIHQDVLAMYRSGGCVQITS